MDRVKIFLKREDGAEDLPVPTYMTPGASGMDLYANVESELEIAPGGIESISTGIALEIPAGFEGQIRPRSGLAARNGVTVLNSPGTIDSDYRGIIRVILINHGDLPFKVCRGDRIAQLVIAPIAHGELVIADELKDTLRGQGGFGHTGI